MSKDIWSEKIKVNPEFTGFEPTYYLKQFGDVVSCEITPEIKAKAVEWLKDNGSNLFLDLGDTKINDLDLTNKLI